jgi:hypothetical protein
MNNQLKPLLDAARRVKMSAKDKEDQRQSFAYGNTAIENSRITREMIRAEAEKLAKAETDDGNRR